MDFRERDSPDYFRLAVGKSVGLLHVPYSITCVGVEKDDEGNIIQLNCRYENETDKKKPKTHIQWVAESSKHGSPIKLNEVRIYNNLFLSENPEAHPNGFLADINPDSLEIASDSLAEIGLWEIISRTFEKSKNEFETVRFQAVRVGYFCLDKDSNLEDPSNNVQAKIILNKIVPLKV